MSKLLCLILAVSVSMIGAPAEAYTECSSSITSVLTADGGAFYIFFASGGWVQIAQADLNREAATAMALTALATGRNVTVRYTANGASCNVARTDFAGLWIY